MSRVLMVTALDQSTDVETAVEAGTDDFITKPINKTELLLRVRAMLESRTRSQRRASGRWPTSAACSKGCRRTAGNCATTELTSNTDQHRV